MKVDKHLQIGTFRPKGLSTYYGWSSADSNARSPHTEIAQVFFEAIHTPLELKVFASYVKTVYNGENTSEGDLPHAHPSLYE